MSDAGPARRLAASAETWSPQDWWLLEAAAWERRGTVLRHVVMLAPLRLRGQIVRERAGSWVSGVVAILGFVGSILAVLFGTAMAVGWMLPDTPAGVPSEAGRAGLALGAVAAYVGWSGATSRSCLRCDPGLPQIVGLLLLLPATAALVGVVAAPMAGVELRDPVGIVGVVALVVVAARMLVVGLRAARDPHPPGTPVAEQHARTAAEETSETVQQGVRADLAAAVDTLAERGLVDEPTRQRALAAPLGGLGVAMADGS